MNTDGRRALSSAENAYLWVACGGICSFEGCNKRLILSSEGELSNVGIKAHIIGHKPKSARHEFMEEFAYTQERLEDVSNLMYMCYDHSKIIDDMATRQQFPPARLFNMKKKHEDWVASWSKTQKKKSIALIHKRLGPPMIEIEYADEIPFILLDAVEEQSQFTDFTEVGWQEGVSRNINLQERFVMKVKEHQASVAEIFPLSPIPLLIHLGTLLTDTIPLTIYQFDRERGLWVADSPVKRQMIELNFNLTSENYNELAVLISISGIVEESHVVDALGREIDMLFINIDNPGVKRILYSSDVKSLNSQIKNEIEKLIQSHKYQKLHLFYAGPAGLAVEIGRGINPRMWPEVYIYNFNYRWSPKYQYALKV